MEKTQNQTQSQIVSVTRQVSLHSDSPAHDVVMHFDFAGVTQEDVQALAVKALVIAAQAKIRTSMRKSHGHAPDSEYAFSVADLVSPPRQSKMSKVERAVDSLEAADQDALLEKLLAAKKARQESA